MSQLESWNPGGVPEQRSFCKGGQLVSTNAGFKKAQSTGFYAPGERQVEERREGVIAQDSQIGLWGFRQGQGTEMAVSRLTRETQDLASVSV